MNKLLGILLCAAPFCMGADQISFLLGKKLLAEGSSKEAAIEFRRFALTPETPAEQKASAYLYAAYSYLKTDTPALAEQMTREAEKTDRNNPAIPLLYAESAAARGDTESALYFLDLLASPEKQDLKEYSTLRRAELFLRSGQPDNAQEYIEQTAPEKTTALKAIRSYNEGPRKSPMVGGLLGLFPGGGYWYSGEIANGFRSLLLNSLFMFGMYHTASEEQWGAFGVISFFEITWYSGSIYGGVDAAHRYNRDQLDQCIDQLNVPEITPDYEVTVPLFQLKVLF